MAVFLLFPAAQADLILASDGKPNAVIVASERVLKEGTKQDWRSLADAAQQARLRESIKDLQRCLGLAAGCKFEIVSSVSPKEKRVQILIGERAAAEFGEPEKKTTYKQGLRIVVRKGSLLNRKNKIGLWGESDLSSSYAIYEFLHRLGFRWFMPSELGEVVPALPDLELKEMDVSFAPATVFRGIWYADQDFQRRNRNGGLIIHAGHALESYVTEKQREEHPEWKAIVNGKPHKHRLKWTHPKVTKAIADAILKRLEKRPETMSVSLSPSDGIGWDEELDPKYDADDWDEAAQTVSKTDRLLHSMNMIVPQVVKKHTKILFGMLAYADYIRPPVREKVHPNLVPQIAPITLNRAHPMTTENHPNGFTIRDLITGWGKAAPAGISAYWYVYNLAEVSAPNPFITKYSTDLPILFKSNVKYWQPETMANFESCMIALNLSIRLSWDASLDPKEVIADLMTKFYGWAADPMSRYWHRIDRAWIETRDFTGCGFGYLRIFSPVVLDEARDLMDEALGACRTPLEYRRVQLANESLILLELFMKLRRDLADGKLRYLKVEADIWRGYAEALARNYKAQYCFGSHRSRSTWPVAYFDIFFGKPYTDGARIYKNFSIVTKKPISQWKVMTDKDGKGDFSAPDFIDKDWKTTDVAVESWSVIGHHNYFGKMWYRSKVKLPAIPAGKKVFLWIPSTDGTTKVFVNGKHVKWKNNKGEQVDLFNGYATPASFDITGALKPGENSFALLCERTFFNEIGTGGLLAPPMIYREK